MQISKHLKKVCSLGTGLAITLIPAFAIALPQTIECRTLSRRDSTEIESCTYSPLETLISITVHRSGKKQSDTVFNALFSAGEKVWKKVWISEGNGKLSTEEQADLRTSIAFPNTALARDPNAQSFGHLLADFLKPNTQLENFDSTSHHAHWDTNFYGSWTPLCHALGSSREASYIFTGDPTHTVRNSVWIIGDPDSDCRGRCGFACYQPGQLRQRQYTQECLNHDACNWVTGQQLGPCADAFWAASAGYLFAPDCD